VTSAVSEKKQLVEEIVLALTGTGAANAQAASLVDQMSRAAQEVDERTAAAFCKALLDSLCEDPGNVRLLEALMILGLAHPDVLKRRGISLTVEGRRLAILLDQRGEGERARCLLELIAARVPEEPQPAGSVEDAAPEGQPSEDVVEGYIKRARSCVKAGRVSEAITWLQEVLLVDRSRRDVARMIRDLRYQDSESRHKRKKVLRNVFFVLLLGAGVTYLARRELQLREQFQTLAPARDDQPPALEARLAALDEMISEHGYWLGRLEVENERARVRGSLDRIRVDGLAAAREKELEVTRNQELAEAARLRGLMHVELGEYPVAIDEFRESLRLASSDWEHRQRIEADIAALEAWQRGER
jgi:tetratricopeptide (TPR) repeat protein